MPSEFGPDIITDVNGDPVGRYRSNQDPSDPQHLHPVPKTNAFGEAITETVRVGGTDEAPVFAEEPVVVMLPYSDPKVVEVLAEQGMEVAPNGVSLIAIEEPTPAAEPAPES